MSPFLILEEHIPHSHVLFDPSIDSHVKLSALRGIRVREGYTVQILQELRFDHSPDRKLQPLEWVVKEAIDAN